LKIQVGESAITSSDVKPALVAASPPSIKASCNDQMHHMQYKLKIKEMRKLNISGVVQLVANKKTRKLNASEINLNM